MAMTGPRHYFALPWNDAPVGGTNILIRIATVLAAAGQDAALLHATPGFRYRFWAHDRPVCHDPALLPAFRRPRSRNPKSWAPPRLVETLTKPASPKAAPGAGDTVVIPEFAYAEIARIYPAARRVIAVQDVFGFFRGYRRDPGGAMLKAAHAVFATSEACAAAVATVYGGPVHRVTLPVGLPGLDYRAEKKPQIAYMPRKRPVEAAAVAAALAEAPETQGYDLIPLHRMGPETVAQHLMDARFFLSFSKEDGFGLPPAEAMRAGSIVIGYTGVGGAEFFTDDTGIVVPDSDIVGLIQATRRAAADYAADPAPFDALRRRAADLIAERYSEAAFEASVRALWEGL